MKTLLLLILCVCYTVSSLSAQNKKTLDSLLRLNNVYLKKDTVKIKLLLDIHKTYILFNSKTGLKYADEALELAQSIHHPFFTATAQFLKGQSLQENGKLEEALQLYAQSRQFYESENKKHFNLGSLYVSIGNVYSIQQKPTLALEYLLKGLGFFLERKQKRGAATAYSTLSTVYQQVNDLGKAEEALDKSEALFTELKDNMRLAPLLIKRGRTQFDIGNYQRALDSFLKALQLLDESIHSGRLYDIYAYLGDIFNRIGDSDKVLIYKQKALAVAESLGRDPLIAESYLNVGVAYYVLKDYDKGLSYYLKALSVAKKIDDKPRLFIIYSKLGAAYLRQKDFEKSWMYLQEAMKLSRELQNSRYTATALHDIGNYYYTVPDSVLLKRSIEPSQRYQKSLEYNIQSLQLYEKTGDRRNISARWASLSILYSDMGDFKQAYNAYKKYVVIKDSILNENIKNEVIRKETQYEFDKKEAQLKYEQQLTVKELEKEKLLTTQQQQALRIKNQTLILSEKDRDLQRLAYLQEKAKKQEREQELKLARQDKRLQTSQLLALTKEKALQLQTLAKKNALIGFLIASLLGLVLAALSLYLWQRQKRLNQEKENSMNFTKQLLQNTEEERRRIAGDLHDSISHELLILKNILQGDIDTISGKIDTIINDVRSISRNLHPVLFDQIGLVLNIKTLVERFQNQNDFMVTTDIDYQDTLATSDELQLYRIIQEALSNAIKYANAHAAKITLQATKQQLLLEIRDNGKGFDVEKTLNSGKAFGLHNIIERARVVGGTTHFQSSSKGTVISIVIPQKS